MTTAAFIILVLFSMPDGTLRAMTTWDAFQTPLACSMRAHRENLSANDRTYVCLSTKHANRMLTMQLSANTPPPPK